MGTGQTARLSLARIAVRRARKLNLARRGEVSQGLPNRPRGARREKARPSGTGRGRATDGRLDWLQAQPTSGSEPAPPRLAAAARRVHALPPQPAPRRQVPHVGVVCAWLTLAPGRGLVLTVPVNCFRFPGKTPLPADSATGSPGSGPAL